MSSLDQVAEPEKPPSLLTVTEAAQVLRIGRTLAYQMASEYLCTGGASGMPVMRVGPSILRVPRWALLELVATGRDVRRLSDLEVIVAIQSRASSGVFDAGSYRLAVPVSCMSVASPRSPPSLRPLLSEA